MAHMKPLWPTLLVAAMTTGFAHSADVLTQHYNRARTGAILTETVLNTTSVKSQTFGSEPEHAADARQIQCGDHRNDAQHRIRL